MSEMRPYNSAQERMPAASRPGAAQRLKPLDTSPISMWILLAILVFTTTSCAASTHQPQRPVECDPLAPGDALPLDRAQINDLAGSFRLVKVLTSHDKYPEHSIRRGGLSLQSPDSVQRAASRRRGLGYLQRANLQFVGEVVWSTEYRESVEIDDGILYVGCRGCDDGSPTHLTITAVSPRGFWGTWRNYQTGIAFIVDRETGERLPDPAGYFCAIRDVAEPS